MGIPNFWLQAIAHHDTVSEILQQEDVEALSLLQDVRCIDNDDITGFTLEFHFQQPNPYFSNAVLTKTYAVPNLLEQEEPVLHDVTGCEIDWLPQKSLLVKE